MKSLPTGSKSRPKKEPSVRLFAPQKRSRPSDSFSESPRSQKGRAVFMWRREQAGFDCDSCRNLIIYGRQSQTKRNRYRSLNTL